MLLREISQQYFYFSRHQCGGGGVCVFLKWRQSGVLRMFCECGKNASVGLKVLAGITKEKEIAV